MDRGAGTKVGRPGVAARHSETLLGLTNMSKSAIGSIFEAASKGDVEAVRSHLRKAPDLEGRNKNGFTALHCAAFACDNPDTGPGVAIIELLLQAGASPNAMSQDGRSALFLAAEFSSNLAPVKRLVAAGADPNVTNSYGTHIVENAMSAEVKAYLSQLTGYAAAPPPVKRKEVKLSATEWRAVKARLDKVFESLDNNGLVAMQDVGTTQDDGFSDCSESFRARGGKKAGLEGICFYTRQDLNRAKRTSLLSLAFWGAPKGDDASMMRVGQKIVEAFQANGFLVDWDNTPSTRPTVYLQSTQEK